MGSPAKLSLFHVSDIHFTDKGQPPSVDIKTMRELGLKMGDDLAKAFLSHVPNFLAERASKGLPKPEAIIVNGDLVDKSVVSGARVDRAFEAAQQFLFGLAEVLGIRDPKRRVLVVPGNHDVDWTPQLSQTRRFRRYLKWVEPFTSPVLSDGQPEPLLIELSDLNRRVSGQLLLLMSPTFGGLPAFEAEAMAEHLLEQLEGQLSPPQIEEVVKSVKRSLDIAAIGTAQRERIARTLGSHGGTPNEGERSGTRIAVLHHHLLPDNQVEVKEFESVIDAGRTLYDLIKRRFDLALTGHKHNRRVLTFRQARREGMDVYCAPSLFRGNQDSSSGFTVIDVHDRNSSVYATLHFYKTAGCQADGEPVPLYRNDAIFRDATKVVAAIPPKHEPQLVEMLESLEKAFSWEGGEVAGEFFEAVWAQIRADIDRLGVRELVLRDPLLHVQWDRFLEHVAKTKKHQLLRMVSLDDLVYWLEAFEPRTDAEQYAKPLRRFKGEKKRILITRQEDLTPSGRQDVLCRVVRNMVRDGFQVSLVKKEHLPTELRRDFGLIGGVAVTEFEGMGTTSRALRIRFGEEAIKENERDWDSLSRACFWRSDERPAGRLKSWLENFPPTRRPLRSH